MSVALKKADGDLYINPDSGRTEIVSGPTKVDQELFCLYTTDYDPVRNWGSYLNIKYYNNVTSLAEFRADLYSNLTAANNLMLQKQSNDAALDEEREKIQKFNNVAVFVDPATQAAAFISEAQVGDPTTTVGKTLFLDFKPLSIRHVVPPPISLSYEYFNKKG